MMTKLEQLGVLVGKISGGMTVSESNKGTESAATAVQSATSAGIGTPWWHATEQLKRPARHDLGRGPYNRLPGPEWTTSSRSARSVRRKAWG